MPELLLRFVHISDTHIHPDTGYIKRYAQYTPIIGAEALVQAVNALPFKPDFILHTGDVAYDPEPDVYPAVAAVLSGLKVPVHYIAGNHDDMSALQRQLMGRSEDELQDHLHYEFEHNGVQVVCLDSNGPHDPEKPSGSVPDSQMEWLNTVCTAADARPLVIAVHHNPLAIGVPWLDDWMRMENGDEFHAIVRQARDRLRGVFYGHIHQNIETLRDGVLYVAAASSWCQFISYPMPENQHVAPDPVTNPGFSLVTISAAQTTIRRHTFAVEV